MNYFLFCLIFFSPLYLVKIGLSFGGSINLFDVALSLAILRIIYYLYINRLFFSFYSFLRLKKKYFWPTTIFVFSFAISYVVNFSSSDWQSGLGAIKSFIVLPIITASLFSFLAYRNEINLYYYYYSLFAFSTALSILGLTYLLTNKLSYDFRLLIFYNSPNYFAMLLSIGTISGSFIILKLFSMPFLKHRKLVLFLGAFAVFINLICLYFTRSFGAQTGTVLVLVAILINSIIINKHFYKKNQPILIFYLISLALLSISLIIAITVPWPTSPSSFRASGPTSLDSRYFIYSSAARMVKEQGLWGIGPENFQNIYLYYQKYFPPYPQWAVAHPHNLLLSIWLFSGLSGIISFFCLIALPLSKSDLTTAVDNKKQLPFQLLGMALLSYFLIHGTVDTTIWKNDLSYVFWMTYFFII